jgi:hypothetical protein
MALITVMSVVPHNDLADYDVFGVRHCLDADVFRVRHGLDD